MGSRKTVQPGWPGEFLDGSHLSPQGEQDIIDCCLAGEGEMPEALRREVIEVANEILESMVLRDADARVLWTKVPTHAEMHETLRSVAYYSKELLEAMARLDMMTASAIADNGFTSGAWGMAEDIFGFDLEDGGVVASPKKREAGPPYERIGKRLVRYRFGDVQDWLGKRRVDPRWPRDPGD